MMLRKFLLGTTLLVGTAVAAQAADLPARRVAPYVPAPVMFSWTGFYIGLNGGYAFSGDDRVGLDERYGGAPFYFNNFGNVELQGGFGGGQIGYNWQYGNVVVGLEADIQGAGIDDTADLTRTPYLYGGDSVRVRTKSQVNWFGTVRPRIGYAWDRFMIYATGGVAFGGVDYRVHYDDSYGFTGVARKDDTRVGYAVGGGFEWAFAPSWSAKLEYQYVNFGRYTVAGRELDNYGALSPYTFSTQATPDFHTVRLGVNYRF